MGLIDIFKSKKKPTCPSCNQQIEALPKRSGTCIHCKQKYYLCKDPEDGKYIFTNDEGKKAIEKKKQHLQDLECSKNNRANFEDALKNYIGYKKQWSFIPGIESFNEKHKGYEALGPVEMDYEYAPGLKYPGDLHCKDSKELEGCICGLDIVSET